MAAANTDKFRKTAPRKSTTLSGSVTDSDTTIACTSLSGWPTDTAVDAVINRVDSNGDVQGTWEGVTAVVSGNNLTNVLRGEEGTASAWAAGTVIELLWASQTWEDAVDGVLVQHNQDGTHSKIQGLDNNQMITQKDSGGTARTLIGLASSDNIDIGGTGVGVINFNVPMVGTNIRVADGGAIQDFDANEWLKFSKTASAVNEITVTNAATGGDPLISATGGDTNIDLELNGKGTGSVLVQSTVKARAYLSSAQNNLTDATWTKVNLDAETYDPGSNFNTSTAVFVAPITGYYQFSAMASFASTGLLAPYRFGAELYVDSSTSVATNYTHSAIAGKALSIPVSDILYLTATQTVQLRAYAETGGSTQDLVAQSPLTYMSVHLLSID